MVKSMKEVFMKVKNNENYFLKKGTLKIVGAAMAALGFLLYFVGWGWISYIIICTFIPIGAALFIVGSSGRSSDEDIDEFISVKMRELDPGLETDKKYSSRLVKNDGFFELEGYEFREGLMFQKTKSGSVRSSEFTKTLMYFLTDGVYLISRRISLITDEAGEDVILELPIGEIDRAEIGEEMKSFSFNGNLFRVKDMRLRILMKDGKEISLPIHDDLRSEGAAERINRAVEIYRKEISNQ